MNTLTDARLGAREAALAAWPIFGATTPTGPVAGNGITTAGDVLVNQTADGVDLNAVWDEFRDLLGTWNTEMSSITDLLSFKTTQTAEAVPQNFATDSMDEASEIGVPTATGGPGDALLCGFTLRDYDKRNVFTWRALKNMDLRQVQSQMDQLLHMDAKLTNGLIMRRLFTPARSRNEFGATVFGLYDGVAPGPPDYLGRTFPATENHYIASGAADIDSADLEDAIRLIQRKGFGTTADSKIVVFCNPDEAEQIAGFRAGEPSRLNGPVARYDFIPANDAPAFLSPAGELIGAQVPGNYFGVKVEGSYGPALVVQSDYIPAGYVLVAATYGRNAPRNVCAFREHPNPAYQNLRLIPGNAGQYPLVESFTARECGTGVRYRGGAVAIQVTTNASYAAPAIAV